VASISDTDGLLVVIFHFYQGVNQTWQPAKARKQQVDDPV
jgi:hypothetical protein